LLTVQFAGVRASLEFMSLLPFTTGVEAVDDLLDQVRIGDNLVFVAQGGSGAWVVDRFIDGADSTRLVVADAGGRHSRDRAAQVLDWSRGGKRQLTPEQARGQLARADEALGASGLFAFDSLTDLSARWGDQPALDLFLWACPRLFRQGSIALWLVDGSRHDDTFVRRLADITQVVVHIEPSEGERIRLRVAKADGRPPTVVGRTLEARLQGGQLSDVGPIVPHRRRFGDMLRELRESRGVGQADLARRVGISPSALSQAERGARGVSADTLMRIYQALGIPLEDAFASRGYHVNRRSTHAATPLASGVIGRRLTQEGVTAWHLTVAARATGRQPLFPVKATEVVTVLRGVLQMEIGGRSETLHEGDALETSGAAITAWSNPADTVTEVMWVIGR
jgi:transcriptional regulator with XRE-family HTH domain